MNIYKVFTCVLIFLISVKGICQHDHHDHSKVYNWNWKQDGVALGLGAGLLATSVYMRNQADQLTIEDVRFLTREDVWVFDRSAVNNTSNRSQQLSDIILYSSYAYPFFHFIDHKPHRGQVAVVGMFAETLMFTASITNMTKALTKRKRPFIFNEDLPLEDRIGNTATFSFPSGHTSVVTSLCFFTAKVHSDLFPNSRWRKFIWGTAITIPAVVGYMRYKAGKHFPTDVITGYALGATIGYLVPALHKVKNQSAEDDHFDHNHEETSYRLQVLPGAINLTVNF